MDEKHETAIDSFNGYSICTPAAMGLAASRVESPIPPPPKRTAVKRSPFEDPACLRLIHDYLGAGHHSFIAPVSKLWKQSYEATPSLSTTGFDVALMKIPLLCDSKTTFVQRHLHLDVQSPIDQQGAAIVRMPEHLGFNNCCWQMRRTERVAVCSGHQLLQVRVV
jgi:hypothetical protein